MRRDGDAEGAARLYEESLALAREQGHQWRVAALTHNLGQIDLERGDAASAARRFAESLAIVRTLGDQRVIAHCLVGLAAVAALATQPHRAARLWGAAEALLETLGAHLELADQPPGAAGRRPRPGRPRPGPLRGLRRRGAGDVPGAGLRVRPGGHPQAPAGRPEAPAVPVR